ncbi:MAG: YHS domain-containing (seleno)protein [Cyanobacteria bacterium P01_A01_bin.123]
MANPINVTETGVALQGYDPVSYFTSNPTAGNPQITSVYAGTTYYFISEENKTQFEADPERYLPEYGGFCAIAVSEGKLVPVDPETYKITDGKLYLFYNGEFGNTKPQWEADEANRRADADAHWEKGDLVKP